MVWIENYWHKNQRHDICSTDMKDQEHALNIMYLHGGEKVQSRTSPYGIEGWGMTTFGQFMKDLESRNGIVHPRYIKDI